MPTYEKLNDYNRKHLSLNRFQMYIKGKDIVEVFPIDTVDISMDREGAPSSLTAKIIDDGIAKIENGNAVNFLVDGKTFWYGYIFQITENKSNIIEIMCYDQLRYLKNKDTYQYESLTYSDLLKRICLDHGLTTGTVEDTGFQIAGRIEEEKEYWDMLETANQFTVAYTGEIFILHDDAGKICLKNMKSMQVNSMVLDQDVFQDYEYQHNINENTYNRIKIDLIDEQENYVKTVTAEDTSNIGKWGLLQYYAQTTERDGVEAKAQMLLKSLNRELRSFKAEDVFGDVNVRAGSLLPVNIRLRDIAISGNMLVDRVTHRFFEEYHLMNLDLYNKDFQFEVNADGFFKKETSQGQSQVDSSGTGSMTGGTVRENIWSYLTSLGYSKAAIAGIMGNVAQESSFKPTAENSSGAFGLFQWLGSRRDALEAYAKSKGKAPTDVLTQLEFMHKELMAMPGGKDFTKMGNVEEAALWFRKKFERPAEWEADDPNRIAQAKQAMKDFQNWTPPKATTATGSGSKFLDYVLKQEGTPYSQEKRFSGAYHDCSSLILRGMRAAGLDTTGANLTTRTIASDPRFVEISKNQLKVGDILWKQGHVAIYMGGNKTFEAKDYGVPTGYSSNIGRFNRYYRIKGM